jgi:hypothetical protein
MHSVDNAANDDSDVLMSRMGYSRSLLSNFTPSPNFESSGMAVLKEILLFIRSAFMAGAVDGIQPSCPADVTRVPTPRAAVVVLRNSRLETFDFIATRET